MTIYHCPTCGKAFTGREANDSPFCSERCQMVDLGRWLDEGYGFPLDSEQDQNQNQEEMPEITEGS